jgi:hypothetical protein
VRSSGSLYAKRHDTFRAYHDRVFERFWKRKLDIESPAALAAVLAECSADIGGFVSFIENEGRRELNEIMREAESSLPDMSAVGACGQYVRPRMRGTG